MSKLEIQAVRSDDVDLAVGIHEDGWERIELWHPKDRSYTKLTITIDIGMVGITGSNLFWLEICTNAYARDNGTEFKRKFVMVVEDFDWQAIRPKIVQRVIACERENWDQSVQELRKHFFWEYETERASRKPIQPLPDRSLH